MTDEEMRIAIAEALGYTHVRIIKDIEGPPDIGIGHHPTKPHSVPDYLNDLNACAEFEATLTDEEWLRWEATAAKMSLPRGSTPLTIWIAQMSPRQRAEAFLKTLNLWKD